MSLTPPIKLFLLANDPLLVTCLTLKNVARFFPSYVLNILLVCFLVLFQFLFSFLKKLNLVPLG